MQVGNGQLPLSTLWYTQYRPHAASTVGLPESQLPAEPAATTPSTVNASAAGMRSGDAIGRSVAQASGREAEDVVVPELRGRDRIEALEAEAAEDVHRAGDADRVGALEAGPCIARRELLLPDPAVQVEAP